MQHVRSLVKRRNVLLIAYQYHYHNNSNYFYLHINYVGINVLTYGIPCY